MIDKIVYADFEDWSERILEGLRGLRVKISRCLRTDRKGDLVISFISHGDFCDRSEILGNDELEEKSVYFYPTLKISIPINDEEGEFIPLTDNERKNLASFIRQQVFYPMNTVEIISIGNTEDDYKKSMLFTFSDFYIDKKIEEESYRSVVYNTMAIYDVTDAD